MFPYLFMHWVMLSPRVGSGKQLHMGNWLRELSPEIIGILTHGSHLGSLREPGYSSDENKDQKTHHENKDLLQIQKTLWRPKQNKKI